MKRVACSAIAAATFGCAWPVELTAMPAAKSRYSSPPVVVTQHPLPLATSNGVTENQTSDRCVLMRECYVVAQRSKCRGGIERFLEAEPVQKQPAALHQRLGHRQRERATEPPELAIQGEE